MDKTKDSTNTELLNSARALTTKLREIAQDGRYLAVWASWANHGGEYNGPFYVEELESLEREIAKTTS